MRLFRMWILPVLLVTGSLASAQQPSAMKLQGRPKITGEWASAPTSPGAIVAPAGGVEAVAAPVPGATIAAPMPAAIGAPVAGPVVGTSMGQCGSGGCGNCGAACNSCGGEGCLARLKAWFCSRPLRACEKQVCYDPVPPLYQFFPCPLEGYCPRLAPPTCCPPPVHVVHPICSTRRPWADTSCGACGVTSCGCGSTCGACSTCGGSASCGKGDSCGCGRRIWLRLFSPLRGSSCRGNCCTPSAQCFTNGQMTGGCADGNCGPK